VPPAETATPDTIPRNAAVAVARIAHPLMQLPEPLSDTNRAVFRPPDPPAYLAFDVLLI
jgi:hypothetical protein